LFIFAHIVVISARFHRQPDSLDLIFFADVAMKSLGGPKSSLCLLGLINQIG
jgi:hypothetical protein